MASIARRPDGTHRARFRDATGKEHARHFTRKVDAQRWLDEMTAAMVTGQYVDPAAGRVTVREFAERWRASQVHRPTTAAHVETMLRRHVYPTLGQKPLSSVLPSDVQALVKRLSLDLAPATVGVVHRILAGIFKAAVRDRRIVASPCEGTKLPKIHRRRVEPMTLEAVQALAEAMPDRYRALVTLAAGTGLRQGEVFGLTVDRVDFLRRQLTVDRQLVTMPDRAPYLGAAEDTGVGQGRAAPPGRRRRPGGAPRGMAGRRLRLHDRARHADPPDRLLRPRLAASGEAGRPERRHLALAAALLRQPAHPARRVREDRPGPTRPRVGRRDPRHLQPSLARLRRPDRGPLSTPSSASLRTLCGLTPPTDPISAGQRRATDESACTPGSVHGCLAASRWAVIHLGLPLPAGSSGLPAGSGGPPSNACAGRRRDRRPFLTLLRVGFTEPHRSPGVRWSLTPPFHPYQCEHWRSVLCGTVPRVAPGRCWRPPCPVEPGRSSAAGSPPPTRPPSRLVRRAPSPSAPARSGRYFRAARLSRATVRRAAVVRVRRRWSHAAEPVDLSTLAIDRRSHRPRSPQGAVARAGPQRRA